jgi:hypothetical protein
MKAPIDINIVLGQDVRMRSVPIAGRGKRIEALDWLRENQSIIRAGILA